MILDSAQNDDLTVQIQNQVEATTKMNSFPLLLPAPVTLRFSGNADVLIKGSPSNITLEITLSSTDKAPTGQLQSEAQVCDFHSNREAS